MKLPQRLTALSASARSQLPMIGRCLRTIRRHLPRIQRIAVRMLPMAMASVLVIPYTSQPQKTAHVIQTPRYPSAADYAALQSTYLDAADYSTLTWGRPKPKPKPKPKRVYRAPAVTASASRPVQARPAPAHVPAPSPHRAAPEAPAYVCPVSALGVQGRVDEGVDYTGTGAIRAIGSGVVTYISYNSGWPGSYGAGVFMVYRLTGGPSDGYGPYVYVAETFSPSVSVGQQVGAGTVLGTAGGGDVGIETGWAEAPGNIPEAAAYSHYTNGVPTAEGYDFQSLLSKLGC